MRASKVSFDAGYVARLFVQQFGFQYPRQKTLNGGMRGVKPGSVHASPVQLIESGIATLDQWCAFLNHFRSLSFNEHPIVSGNYAAAHFAWRNPRERHAIVASTLYAGDSGSDYQGGNSGSGVSGPVQP